MGKFFGIAVSNVVAASHKTADPNYGCKKLTMTAWHDLVDKYKPASLMTPEASTSSMFVDEDAELDGGALPGP